MNAYERMEYFPTREYADTRIEALDSTDEKALYCESRFEDIDGITTYVVKTPMNMITKPEKQRK